MIIARNAQEVLALIIVTFIVLISTARAQNWDENGEAKRKLQYEKRISRYQGLAEREVSRLAEAGALKQNTKGKEIIQHSQSKEERIREGQKRFKENKDVADLIGWTSLIIVLFVFPLPTYIAFSRKHHQRGSVAVVNLLLGATGIGWIGCLVWAMCGKREEKLQSVEKADYTERNVVTRLEDVVQLYERGHLTKDEFEAQKRKLLEI